MVFSMAMMPSMSFSALSRSNISSKVSQQTSRTSSPSKKRWAAMSWKLPSMPCIAICFIVLIMPPLRSPFWGVPCRSEALPQRGSGEGAIKLKVPLHYVSGTSFLSCLLPYTLFIYTTTRFTLFAKVKVIIEAEVKLVAVSHRVILCF